MIRPGRNTRYTAAGSTGSDTDALQTDVMRFMSILGLCLMAVFALVQSIPLQETDTVRPEPERVKLQQDIALQLERTRVLQNDLDRLMEQIQSAQAHKTNTQQALSSARQQLTLIVGQTAQAHSERDHLTTELEALKYQLAQGRDELAGIQQAAQKQEQTLRKLQPKLSEEQKKLDAIRKRASALKNKQASTPRSPVTEKHPPPAPGPGKQGFTLRFASAEALHRLVVTGTVSLYGMADKQAWRLSLGKGSPAFAHDAFPVWFHEMAPSTVPPEYVQTLEKSRGQLAQSSIVWGVQLPPATKQGIASLTTGLQGGSLVIGADGQVTLEPE